MSAELLSSKVLIQEEEPTVRGIPTVSTSVAGAVGVAERGPIGEAVLVTSWEEYVRVFGGFVAGADLPAAVLSFFQNGGGTLWVVRTCHYTNRDVPATATARVATGALQSTAAAQPAEIIGRAGPFALQPNERFSLLPAEGDAAVVTFLATPATVRSLTPGPFTLLEGTALGMVIDNQRSPYYAYSVRAEDFEDLSAATAEEFVAAFNRLAQGVVASVDLSGHVVLTSLRAGQVSRLELDGTLLGFARDASGTGNVRDISEVTVAEVRQIVEAAAPWVAVGLSPAGHLRIRTRATGPSASLRVTDTSSPRFGFDGDLHTGAPAVVTTVMRVEAKSPGAWGNRLVIDVGAGGAPDTFDILVRVDGVLREAHRDLQMAPDSPRHPLRIVNDAKQGSALIKVVDLRVPGAAAPAVQTVALDGGDNGTNGLDELDFIGSPIGRTGKHALDDVQDLSILFVPGQATATIHADLLRYCEDERQGAVFAVLDPPPELTAAAMVVYQTQTAGLEGLTEHGAIYWPRLAIANPDKRTYGPDATIVVPPSGAVAGTIARTDASRNGGVYEPPAGVEVGRLRSVMGLETNESLDEKKRDILYPRRINPINRVPGGAHYVDGVRTLKGNGNFPTIAERRGVSHIERSLRAGLQFARHRNNDDALAAQVFRTIKAFLLQEMNLGAFASKKPDEAFYVEVSRDPAERFRGELHVEVGLATQKPAEFIVIRIRQDTRALDAQLAVSR
jgi:phage tail sheath protein FI